MSSDVSGKNTTLTVDACNISGKLTVIGGHASVAGVTVSLGPYLAVTGPDGSYVLTVPYGMSGDIIVSIPGYSQITVASVKDLFADISGKDLVLKANVYMVVFKDYGGSKISEVSVLWGLNSRILWLHQDNEIRPLLGSSRPKRRNASLAPLLM